MYFTAFSENTIKYTTTLCANGAIKIYLFQTYLIIKHQMFTHLTTRSRIIFYSILRFVQNFYSAVYSILLCGQDTVIEFKNKYI